MSISHERSNGIWNTFDVAATAAGDRFFRRDWLVLSAAEVGDTFNVVADVDVELGVDRDPERVADKDGKPALEVDADVERVGGVLAWLAKVGRRERAAEGSSVTTG